MSGGPGEVDLFGSLDRGADDCVPAAGAHRYETLPYRYLVVLGDNTHEARKAVLEVAQFGTVYPTLPLVEIQGSEEDAARLAAMPEVLSVVPAMGTVDSTRTVAAGLDFLSGIAAAQSSGVPPEGERASAQQGGLPAGWPGGYPVVRDQGERLMVDSDPEVDWPTAPAIMPVINMSLGTKAIDYPSQLNDLVNVATVAASDQILLVMAAGNCGTHAGETMSAWAEPDWVLAVGATEDAEGTVLADYSARGHEAAPASGPDLVTHGRSEVAPHPVGTSFAAPRVAGLAMVAAAAILQVRRIARHRAGIVEGVPLVGLGFIDSFPTEIWGVQNPKLGIGALPVVGVDETAVAASLDLAAAAGIEVTVVGGPGLLRSLLLESATPMAGYDGHEVGRGFIDRRRLLDRLAALTGEDLVRWFGDTAPDDELSARLRTHLLFDRDGLEKLAHITIASAPEWRYDWKRSRVGWVPVSEDEVAALPDDQRLGGFPITWPPPFEG